MEKEFRLIEISKRMRALAQIALTYVDDEYQRERYNEYLEQIGRASCRERVLRLVYVSVVCA